jgi:hypothetical protein
LNLAGTATVNRSRNVVCGTATLTLTGSSSVAKGLEVTAAVGALNLAGSATVNRSRQVVCSTAALTLVGTSTVTKTEVETDDTNGGPSYTYPGTAILQEVKEDEEIMLFVREYMKRAA